MIISLSNSSNNSSYFKIIFLIVVFLLSTLIWVLSSIFKLILILDGYPDKINSFTIDDKLYIFKTISLNFVICSLYSLSSVTVFW